MFEHRHASKTTRTFWKTRTIKILLHGKKRKVIRGKACHKLKLMMKTLIEEIDPVVKERQNVWMASVLKTNGFFSQHLSVRTVTQKTKLHFCIVNPRTSRTFAEEI